MKKIILAFTLVTTLLFSCKKDNGSSKSDTLIAGKWQLTAANLNGALDVYPTLQSCITDNFYTFNSNKTVTIDEGATKCNTTDAQDTTTGSWSLINSESQLSISDLPILNGQTIIGKIVELDNATIKLSQDTTITGVGSGTINLTFTNKK